MFLFLVQTDLFVVVEVSPSDVVVVIAAFVLLVAFLHPRTRVAPRRLKRQLRRNLRVDLGLSHGWLRAEFLSKPNLFALCGCSGQVKTISCE